MPKHIHQSVTAITDYGFYGYVVHIIDFDYGCLCAMRMRDLSSLVCLLSLAVIIYICLTGLPLILNFLFPKYIRLLVFSAAVQTLHPQLDEEFIFLFTLSPAFSRKGKSPANDLSFVYNLNLNLPDKFAITFALSTFAIGIKLS